MSTAKYFAHVFIALLSFVFFSPTVYAQFNFSETSSWLKDNLKQLGGRAVLVVWKDGQIVLNDAENDMNGRQKMAQKLLARRQGNDPAEAIRDFTSASRERIASSSKWLSAALVMTFVDQGKLRLTDSVGKYLPVMTQHGKGAITISQCLSHLTGIETADLKESLEGFKEIKTMDESIQKIASLPMEGEPGKTFHYGNTGLQIAAAVCEVVGHDSFENLFYDRIAKPCHMRDTDFGKTKVPLAAGGAWSTAEDYTNFMVMLLQKGMFAGERVLSQKSILEMQANRTKNATIAYSPAEASDMMGYGFGEWIHNEDGQETTVVSSPGLFGSFPWIDKKRRYTGFLLVLNLQTRNRRQMYTQLKQTIDKAIDLADSKK